MTILAIWFTWSQRLLKLFCIPIFLIMSVPNEGYSIPIFWPSVPNEGSKYWNGITFIRYTVKILEWNNLHSVHSVKILEWNNLHSVHSVKILELNNLHSVHSVKILEWNNLHSVHSVKILEWNNLHSVHGQNIGME
jgi:hypothetical protein